MKINEIIISVMVVFAVLGALDRMTGNHFGLGKKFEEGIMAIGPLSLSMVGILVLAPVIANVLKPVVVPAFQMLGADPAMFAGAILANDMGGAPLAKALALNEAAGNFSGLIVGSMMGVTIVFTIPASMGMTEEADREFLAKGVLAGVITVPLGCFAGGLAAGYSVKMILSNLIPVILFAVLIALGLSLMPNAMVKGFEWFGKFIVGVATLGLIVGIVEALTGIIIFSDADPIQDGFAVVADIAIVLAGAFPMLHVLTKLCKKLLQKLGKLLGINETATAGMVASLANSVPMFHMIKDMDGRGKVINMAFAVSAAFVFGDHLGFTAGFQDTLVVPVIIGKLVGGYTAVLVALWMTRNNRQIEKEE